MNANNHFDHHEAPSAAPSEGGGGADDSAAARAAQEIVDQDDLGHASHGHELVVDVVGSTTTMLVERLRDAIDGGGAKLSRSTAASAPTGYYFLVSLKTHPLRCATLSYLFFNS